MQSMIGMGIFYGKKLGIKRQKNRIIWAWN